MEDRGSIRFQLIDDEVLQLQQRSWTVNMTAISTKDGVVVVDSFPSPHDAKAAQSIIHEVFRSPVVALINTHHHYDHSLGNQVFETDFIYGHTLCRERMIAFGKKLESSSRMRRPSMAGFRMTPPEILLEKSTVIEVGDKEINILYKGAAHTDNDLMVYLPANKILITGDVYVPKATYPINLNSGSDISNWATLLRQLESELEKDTVVVPGHLGPQKLSGLGLHASYFEHLLEQVVSARDVGMSWRDVLNLPWQHESKEYLNFQRFHPNNVQVAMTYINQGM